MIFRNSFCRLIPLAIIVLSTNSNIFAATAPTLTVNATSSEHAISPNIYGIANGVDPTLAEEIKLPNVRWGGDGATRYNWELDSSNSGADWYFIGGNGEASPVEGAQVDSMIKTYKASDSTSLVTIPIIPYVNKSSEYNCSFPTNVYGAQQSINPYIHPNGTNCGNGVYSNGSLINDKNIGSNNIANSTSLQQGFVEHLVATHGTAAKGGVEFYQLDNEPGGWSNTQRDIEPTEPTYKTITSLGESYAAVIKNIDSTAMVLGPSDFTYGGWIMNPATQNNLYAGQYYLQQMAAFSKAKGKRMLDYFDEHYYPQFSNPTQQLAATRTLWDTTYKDGDWVEEDVFHAPLALVPRFQSWVNEYYPGTKVSFSEYSIDSGNKLITDALAEADLLGVFGREEVALANMWNPPATTDPIAFAFRLYRNYDGKGSEFGNTSVASTSSNQNDLSIYGAVRSSDGALTMVVINKTTAAINTKLTIDNFASSGAAEIYTYSKASLNEIESGGSEPLQSNTLTRSYPAYSATVVVLAKVK